MSAPEVLHRSVVRDLISQLGLGSQIVTKLELDRYMLTATVLATDEAGELIPSGGRDPVTGVPLYKLRAVTYLIVDDLPEG